MPGANLRMPLTSVAVRQRWKDPSLELKLQYHNVKKERKTERNTTPCIQNSTPHVVCVSGEVSARAGRLQYCKVLPPKKLYFNYSVFPHKITWFNCQNFS